jgi:hypothetical protein
MYTWFVFLHLVGIILFVIAHGVSASVSFQVRRERNLDRLRALAELSATSYPLTYGGLLLLLVSGIIAGFMGHWWGGGWIWSSIIVLIAIIVGMVRFGSNYFNRLRKAVGSPYRDGNKIHPPDEPASMAEIETLLAAGKPWVLTLIGFGGLILVAWLMMFKPF